MTECSTSSVECLTLSGIPSFLPCVVAWQPDLPSASTNTQPLIVEVTLELSTSGETSSNDLFLAAPSLLQKVCKEF